MAKIEAFLGFYVGFRQVLGLRTTYTAQRVTYTYRSGGDLQIAWRKATTVHVRRIDQGCHCSCIQWRLVAVHVYCNKLRLSLYTGCMKAVTVHNYKQTQVLTCISKQCRQLEYHCFACKPCMIIHIKAAIDCGSPWSSCLLVT